MTLLRILICLLLVALLATPEVAQDRRNALMESYDRARQILNAGIEALGGLDALRSVKTSRVAYSGRAYANYQSPNPDPPYMALGVEAQVIIDRKS
jgi:hypothetical protein